jgi:hypothetical protein
MTGDGDRFVETGAPLVGHGLGKRVQHRLVGQYLVTPTAAECPGEPERASAAHDPAVEVEARRRPSPGTIHARRIDPPGQARYAGIDGHPVPTAIEHSGPASIT